MKKEKSCKNCLMGVRINVNSDILCRINGAVSEDFLCSRHKAAKIPIVVKDEQFPKCLDCEFFIADGISPEDIPSIGYCQMFTVRHFNGSFKKACSRFSLKPELCNTKTG